MDHLGYAALRCAMDALERPGEKGRSVRGSVACGKGKIPKEVKGGGANAPSNFNAEWEKSVALGRGDLKPFGVLLSSSFIIRSTRCVGTLDTITS